MNKLATVDRVLRILTAVARRRAPVAGRSGWSVTTGLPPSTLYRHLNVLRRWGFVEAAERGGTYEPGPMSLQLAWGGRTSRLVNLARDEILRLVEATGESAGLMVTVNAQVVCLDMVESPQSLRCSFRKGSARPWRSTAPRRRPSSLSCRPANAPRSSSAIWVTPIRPRAGRSSAISRSYAARATRSAKARSTGASGVSVPILNRADRMLGGLSLMAPSVRVAGRQDKLIHATVAAAGRIAGKF